MSVHVSMRREKGMAVLALGGIAERSLLEGLARGVKAVAEDLPGPLLVDVDGLAFDGLDDVCSFMALLRSGPVGSRLSFVGGPPVDG